MNRESRVGVGLAVVSVVYFIGATRLPRQGPGPGPGTLPMLLAVGLFVVALSFVDRGRRMRREECDQLDGVDPRDVVFEGVESRLPRVRATRVMLVTILYVPAFHFLGFFISTSGLLLALSFAFGSRRIGMAVALAVVMPVLLFLLFASGLGVSFPLNPFSGR